MENPHLESVWLAYGYRMAHAIRFEMGLEREEGHFGSDPILTFFAAKVRFEAIVRFETG